MPKRPLEERTGAVDCSKDGKTKQEFKDVCDINNVMSQLQKGLAPQGTNLGEGQFIDTTPYGDVQETMQTIARARSEWERMPGSVKSEFRNNPENFMEFVNNLEGNEKNMDKAEALGLIKNRRFTKQDKPAKKEKAPEPKKEEE